MTDNLNPGSEQQENELLDIFSSEDTPNLSGGDTEEDAVVDQAPAKKVHRFKASGRDYELAEDDPQLEEFLSFGATKHQGLQELANQRKEFEALKTKELAEIEKAKTDAAGLIDQFFQTDSEELKELKRLDPDEYLRRTELREKAVKQATELKKAAIESRHLTATEYLNSAFDGDVNGKIQETFASLSKKGASQEATQALVEFADGPILELLHKGQLYEKLQEKAKNRSTEKAKSEPPAKKPTKSAPQESDDNLSILFG